MELQDLQFAGNRHSVSSPPRQVFTDRSGEPLSPRTEALYIADGFTKAVLQAAAMETGAVLLNGGSR